MKEKTKIIISIDWFLPGTNSGGPVSSIANLLQHIHEFDFYILTRDTDYCATEIYPDVDSNAWNKLSPHVQVYYFSEDQLTKKNLKRVIKDVEASSIYINGIYSKFFSIYPIKIAQNLHLKIIIASRGMLSPHAVAVKPFKKKLFLQLANLINRYNEVYFHATQAEEKQHIKQLIHNFKAIEVIPNFPRKVKESEIKPLTKTEGEVRFISLGRISEEKGTLLSIQALQHIKGKVELDLYGTIYSASYWEKCQESINTLPEEVQVNYKGSLNTDEVISTLGKYHFLLLPSKGENFGHSIIESFLVNRPVIISKHTPWKDLEEKNIGFDVKEEDLEKTIQKVVNLEDLTYQKMLNDINKQKDNLVNIKKLKKDYINLFCQ